MRGAISKSGSNDSLAAARDWHCGGQGVHREVESEGHEEKYRAVIDGGCPADEPVGQRWPRSSLRDDGVPLKHRPGSPPSDFHDDPLGHTCPTKVAGGGAAKWESFARSTDTRSEEHTSELQSLR